MGINLLYFDILLYLNIQYSLYIGAISVVSCDSSVYSVLRHTYNILQFFLLMPVSFN